MQTPVTSGSRPAEVVAPTVIEHPGFDGVPEAHWEMLNCEGGLFTSRRFMTALECVEPAPDSTVKVFEARGYPGAALPVAALPCFGVPTGGGGRYDAAALVRSILPDAALPGQPRSLLLGARAGYQNRMLVAPGLPLEESASAVRALVDAAVRQPTEGPPPICTIPYLDTANARLVRAALPDYGHLALAAGDAVIDLPEGGLEGYINGLQQRRRTRIRREMRQFAESPCEITQAPLGEVCGELAGLLVQNLRKYGDGVDERVLADMFRRYGEVLGDDVQVILARLDGRAVAYVSLYRWKQALYARSWGGDPQVARDAALYFNLVYYEPIRMAARLGVSALHLGILAYEAKVLRGARLEPRWTLLAHPNLCHADFTRALARWNSEQLAALQAWTPPGLLDPDDVLFTNKEIPRALPTG
ncbi:GNAT family N-acetyltransferase [Streptomyces sp. NPDC090029]|uniref:GNAT family N-acetyltransferase n=1 Tax=Streptomyces sp. NPDC090029 TaxID=3365924 RepID=UPI0038078293